MSPLSVAMIVFGVIVFGSILSGIIAWAIVAIHAINMSKKFMEEE